jgi:hypothetical protein
MVIQGHHKGFIRRKRVMPFFAEALFIFAKKIPVL